jgi:hypothetical protein
MLVPRKIVIRPTLTYGNVYTFNIIAETFRFRGIIINYTGTQQKSTSHLVFHLSMELRSALTLSKK